MKLKERVKLLEEQMACLHLLQAIPMNKIEALVLPTGKDLVGKLCGFSDVSMTSAKTNATGARVGFVTEYHQDKEYKYKALGSSWVFAHPVSIEDAKEWCVL